MKHTNLMNWQAFKDKLMQNSELHLQFQYNKDKWVDTSYHITEVKQAPITSVDCGGKMNSWTEIIIQLWEPANADGGKGMKVSKALSIIDLVEKSLPLNPLGIVKIEFGNSAYETRQMYPGTLSTSGENMIIDLNPDFTQCKAINRGGSCGTNDSDEECCSADNVSDKPKIQMVNLATNAASCNAGSGCC